MNKQTIKEALMHYAKNGQSVQADLWPGIETELRDRITHEASPNTPTSLHLEALTVRKRRLHRAFTPALVAVALVLALIAAVLFAGPQATKVVSAAEIIDRAQAAAKNPPFSSFHGIKVSRDIVEGRNTTSRTEEWFIAPDKYCANIVVNDPVPIRSSKCVTGTQGTWYMSMWDLTLLRDFPSIPFDGSANLDNVLAGRFSDLYDRTLMGTEQIMGRTAWILDITLKDPLPASAPEQYVDYYPHKRAWIDQEAFFVLKTQIWDRDDKLASTLEYESFEINKGVFSDALKISPPADALVADLHSTPNDADRTRAWQNVAQHADYPLQMGPARLPDLDAGNPYYDERTGVVTSAYYSFRSGSSSLFLGLVLAQGPVSALSVEGEGQEVEQNGIKGYFYPVPQDPNERDYTVLVIDRDGMRTVIRNYQYIGRAGADWTLYEQLTAVPKK